MRRTTKLVRTDAHSPVSPFASSFSGRLLMAGTAALALLVAPNVRAEETAVARADTTVQAATTSQKPAAKDGMTLEKIQALDRLTEREYRVQTWHKDLQDEYSDAVRVPFGDGKVLTAQLDMCRDRTSCRGGQLANSPSNILLVSINGRNVAAADLTPLENAWSTSSANPDRKPLHYARIVVEQGEHAQLGHYVAIWVVATESPTAEIKPGAPYGGRVYAAGDLYVQPEQLVVAMR